MRVIITADWHVRRDRPRCRLDEDWIETQHRAIRFIIDCTREWKAELIIVGDLFHTPQQPAELVNIIIDELSLCYKRPYIFPGNHDLPYHNEEYLDKCSLGILLRNFRNGQELPWDDITLIHELIFPPDVPMPPNVHAKTADQVLKDHPGYKWIFVGDYHQQFIYENGGRTLLNPGCILRQAADMINYKPQIAFVDTEQSIIKWIPIPDPGEMVTDEYIKERNARDERISAFVETIKSQGQVSFDFRENLEKKLTAAIKEPVKDVVREIMEAV